MDPSIDNEWLGCKNEPVEEVQTVGNVARSWQWRERGIDPPNHPSNKKVLENIAEDILVQKTLQIRCCDLPGYPRSTFLMVFSPDGTKVASTHGNHNVYISELASGKHVRILKGHPRTPWCVAFHPSHPQLIGSGCLGGQVRVWDISSGGSEVWDVQHETIIASIAFHPREQLLVIATYNELYFWDWSQPAPFTKVSTNNNNEKVRYVAFDSLGYKLITGISLWGNMGCPNNTFTNIGPIIGATNNNNNNNNNNNRRDDNDGGTNRQQDNPNSAQDMIVNSYQNLVQRYDSLVRNYQRLFMVRHRLTNTPPPPNTVDRGTDPMETDGSTNSSGWNRTYRPPASPGPEDGNPTPGPSRRQDATDSGDGESSSRLLNLDVLSFDSNQTRNQERSAFGSRSSAFQPLNDGSGRSFRTIDQNEGSTRVLPNPFLTSNDPPRPTRDIFTSNPHQTNTSGSSLRTSIFHSSRIRSSREIPQRRRNANLFQQSRIETTDSNTSTANDSLTSDSADPLPSTSGTQRPTMTNSSTQMSPISDSAVEAQNINESLDLIRDILRDSGTRLLNLITNMSLSLLANDERNTSRTSASSRPVFDDAEAVSRAPGHTRTRLRLFNSSIRRELLSSSSDSDSDQSLEVNIFRTRNLTFREGDAEETVNPTNTTQTQNQATDRMVFELDATPTDGFSRAQADIDRLLSNSVFRIRTQNRSSNPGSSNRNSSEPPNRSDSRPSTRNDSVSSNRGSSLLNRGNSNLLNRGSSRLPERPSPSGNTSNIDLNRPSTSRDEFWAGNNALPPEEAFRKVRGGVAALQKHTAMLTDLWLHGQRMTMRQLRNMWENLRRHIFMIYRQTGRQDFPTYYTRSFLERCMMLTGINDSRLLSYSRLLRNIQRTEQPDRNSERSSRTQPAENASESRAQTSNTPSTSNLRQSQSGSVRTSQRRTSGNIRNPPMLRRRVPNFRWRTEDELRRRTGAANRLSQRYSPRSRRDFARAIEISATKQQIRMRAMHVLSATFNMMMMCLEERGLSQLIINMLRELKKALALTCLMLMTNRNNSQTNSGNPSTAQRVESLNVIRIENIDHSEPVNVDGPASPAPNHSTTPETEPNRAPKRTLDTKPTECKTPKIDRSDSTVNSNLLASLEATVSTSDIASQKWSSRLAVQIAAANRNNSSTARTRRDLYVESKRLKALHRTNPNTHLLKKKSIPPITSHRIPVMRHAPSKVNPSKPSVSASATITSQSEEPVAGPSSNVDQGDNRNQEERGELMNEFEHRVNLIRIAHLQSVRLRNAARSRLRRLQTIRLYTPSSVREMFALQSNNIENQQGSRSPMPGSPEMGNRRPFSFLGQFSPHILLPRSETNNRAGEDPGHFHTVLNSVAMPLMQINDLPVNSDPPSGATEQRGTRTRIQEYLQPIILAQNSMVVDEDAGPGNRGGGPPYGLRRMASFLDAGYITDPMASPCHRVQAWDFTTGDTPDIADSAKNVVVQRCRIHNDASIDISKDGRLLVALLPVARLRNANHWLGVYSLEWRRLGQCLHTAALEQSAVSVALSPTARHLAVGLGSRRFAALPHGPANVFALLYRLDPLENSSRTGLTPIKELEQNWEQGFTSLNCLRWAPQPGQGLVYANNTGKLIIMS